MFGFWFYVKGQDFAIKYTTLLWASFQNITKICISLVIYRIKYMAFYQYNHS